MLVLVIGDLNLPYKAVNLPAKFRKLLVPGRIQQVICTGNVCDKQTYEYLRSLGNEIHVVKGDLDENRHFPTSLVLRYPPFKIGIIHGHQVIPEGDSLSLSFIAQSMDVDILLFGNSSKFEAYKLGDRFFLSPGSASGSWSMSTNMSSALFTKSSEEKAGDKETLDDTQASESKTNNVALQPIPGSSTIYQHTPSFACAYCIADEKCLTFKALLL